MRFGLIGGSYVASSTAIADEETINLYQETRQTQGVIAAASAYGGKGTTQLPSLLRTPGLSVFSALPGTPRGQIVANGRYFAVSGAQFVEIAANGAVTNRGAVANDGNPASLAFNSIQILIISGGHAYCFTLATNALLEVSASLTGVPVQCDYDDTYFVVWFANSNKYQMSQVLDGTTWPGQLVNEVSVFPDNIVGGICNHRELWLFGPKRGQVYQDTGSAEVFDPIGGALIETGLAATFAISRLDNSVFWVTQDERGLLSAVRSNGYTPSRISTYAVETDLATYSAAQIAGIVAYTYAIQGHLFWVLYIPGAQWSWVFDVNENQWHKRATWNAQTATWGPHLSWNHALAFGKHLVGDWNSSNIYWMDPSNLTDNGANIRRFRQTPIVGEEMQRLFHSELVLDFETGLGPQPPLQDGNGNPRQPQAMLQWSDDRGKTWSNQHILNCGFAGKFRTRVIQRRLGNSRYRIYQVSMTDAVPWVLVDGYLTATAG